MPSAYEVTTYGAGFTALYAPPAAATKTAAAAAAAGAKTEEKAPFNILLALPHASLYSTHPHPYFHSTIGRVANRIENARLEGLNGGRSYTLAANNGPNNSHGGDRGWDKRDWHDHGLMRRAFERGVGDHAIRWAGQGQAKDDESRRDVRHFTLTSPDGDEGFPGTVEARVWYAEGVGAAGENVVEVEWEAELVDENVEETVVSMTNHAYFNLNQNYDGGSSSGTAAYSIADHTAKLATARYLPSKADNAGVPAGHFADFAGIPRVPFGSFALADDDGDVLVVDDCFVLDDAPARIPTDTRHWPLQTLAEVHGDRSGVHLAVESTEPAFQFYTGEYVDVPPWPAGELGEDRWEAGDGYTPFSGFCVEPSRYVNAAGREDWRNMVLLKKGKLYGARTRYVISRSAKADVEM